MITNDGSFGDRAPLSRPTRRRKDYRSKGKCPDCEVGDGEVHLITCETRSHYVG